MKYALEIFSRTKPELSCSTLNLVYLGQAASVMQDDSLKGLNIATYGQSDQATIVSK